MSDWTTIEPDESRPVEITGANNTVIVTYPYTNEVTSYAKDSTIDIGPDRWGNLIVSVNGADVVVMPKPFAIDARGKRFELDYDLDPKNNLITITGDLDEAQYPVTIDPTERVTNGGFETGDLSGWDGVGSFGLYSIMSDGAYAGTYYLNVQGGGGYSGLQQTINYNGVNSASSVAAMPVRNTYDVPVSNIYISIGNWLINNPWRTIQDWTVRSATPTLSGLSNVSVWTYASTHGYIDSVSVTVPDAPVADFTGTPTIGYKPLTVKFTDLSTNSPNVRSWDFGDGDSTNSTVQNPVHTYSSAGTYTVELTATNSGGSDAEEKVDYITVETPTYSMTNIQYYDNIEDLYPYGMNIFYDLWSWLEVGQGWSRQFYETESDVNEADFGSQDSGYQGLDEADFHYHFGHGSPYIPLVGTYIQFYNWDDFNISFWYGVTHDEVYKKWDLKNKWVIIDACHILEDQQWGGALKYSHGILGFASTKGASDSLPDRFFENSITYDYTMAYSWEYATSDTYPGSGYIGRVIFDTEDQLYNDHLPGQGYVAADEYPDDDTVYWYDWTC